MKVQRSEECVDHRHQIPRPVGRIGPAVVLVVDHRDVVLAVGQVSDGVVDDGHGHPEWQVGGGDSELGAAEQCERQPVGWGRRGVRGQICQLAVDDERPHRQRGDHNGFASAGRVPDLVVERDPAHRDGLVGAGRGQTAAHHTDAGWIVHHLGRGAGKPVLADQVVEQVVALENGHRRPLGRACSVQIETSDRQVGDQVRHVERAGAADGDPGGRVCGRCHCRGGQSYARHRDETCAHQQGAPGCHSG